MSAKKKKSALVAKIEKAITAILDDPTATVVDRIRAIEAGTKLATAQHKIGGGEEEGSFYG